MHALVQSTSRTSRKRTPSMHMLTQCSTKGCSYSLGKTCAERSHRNVRPPRIDTGRQDHIETKGEFIAVSESPRYVSSEEVYQAFKFTIIQTTLILLSAIRFSAASSPKILSIYELLIALLIAASVMIYPVSLSTFSSGAVKFPPS